MDGEPCTGMGVWGWVRVATQEEEGSVCLGNQVWRRQSQVIEWEVSGVVAVPSALLAGRV